MEGYLVVLTWYNFQINVLGRVNVCIEQLCESLPVETQVKSLEGSMKHAYYIVFVGSLASSSCSFVAK